MPDLALAVAASIATVLFVREYILRRNLSRRHEELLKLEEQKSGVILSDAIKKAQDIVTQAELSGVKVSDENKELLAHHQAELDRRIQETLSAIQRAFQTDLDASRQEITKTEQLFQGYIGELTGRLNRSDQAAETALKTTTDKSVAILQEDFAKFLSELESKTLTSVDSELKASRERVRQIEEKRIHDIEENLVSIIEKTVGLVLARKLSLAEHVEFVEEAFARAKEEGAL